MRRRVLFASETVVNNGQGYFPQDIKALYNIPNDLNGENQTIGILEFSNGYNLKDAKQFWSRHGIPSPQVVFVSVDGTPNDRGINPDDEEATLDLQWAGALAPKAQIIIYESNAGNTYRSFTESIIVSLRYILNDTKHHPSVLSISYGDAEVNLGQAAMEQIAQLVEQLDAKGITVCISSGDQGAYGMHDLNRTLTRHADGPATAPAAVAVGGTSLKPDGTETAWTYLGSENGGATGGGFSSIFPSPPYQKDMPMENRGIPDISFNADPATGYQIIFQGKPAIVGGTSVSCPVFAAVVALANQRRAQLGLPSITGLTRILYQHSKDITYHDITVGNNSFNGVTGYNATTGWDACTGWGSLDAAKFIQFLAAYSEGSVKPTPKLPTPSYNTDPFLPTHQSHSTVVHVTARIKTVEQDVKIHGVSHHHLLVDDVRVLSVHGESKSIDTNEVFVAIRYGDPLGLAEPIVGLENGQPIELQGEYVDKNQVYPSIGNPGDPVIHYTHHPVGFVIYKGTVYK